MRIRNNVSRIRPIRILIGNCEGSISDAVASVINHAFDSQFEVCSMGIGSPIQLLAWAKDQEYDLFVVVLNNLLIASDNRLNVALNVVSSLKTQYNKPVIAMCAHFDNEPQLGDKAKRAGADAFFFLPFDVTEFVSTAKRLLGSYLLE